MAEKLTKKEAVRLALVELGNNAMPVALQGWVKDKLDVGISVVYVSTIKGQLLREDAKKPALARPTPVSEQSSPAKAAPAAANGRLIQLADLQALKTLVVRVGPETLRTLIAVMAK